MAEFIDTYQLQLILTAFGLGALSALMIYRQPATSRAWAVADLVWVLLGGIGAITAIVAGIYQEDSTRLERQITVAFTASHSFDSDAARFRLRHCAPADDPSIKVLCEKVEFLSASTAGNAALPLFLSVTQQAAPLEGLRFLLGGGDLAEMRAKANQFNPDELLVFDPRDVSTVMALEYVMLTQSGIAADYRVLALNYDDLITQVLRLKQDWDLLQTGRPLLILQIIALCLVAFAAPFRLGKSLVSLV